MPLEDPMSFLISYNL